MKNINLKFKIICLRQRGVKMKTLKIIHYFKFLVIKHQIRSGTVAERLLHRSCDQKVPCSIHRSGISVEVTSQ